MQSNFYGILTATTPHYTVDNGFFTTLYDAGGEQGISVQPGGSLSLLGASGHNDIMLHGDSEDWQVSRDGSTAIFTHVGGDRVEIPAMLDFQTIYFEDGSAFLQIDTSGDAPRVMLGDQELTTAPSVISAWDDDGEPGAGDGGEGDGGGVVGSTEQAAWTLLMTYSGDGGSKGGQWMPPGLYASDGSAQGSRFLVTEVSAHSSELFVSADQSQAILFAPGGWIHDGYSYRYTDVEVYGSDGTAAGTVLLGDGLSGTPYVFGDVFALLGEAGLVTDGTEAGTAATSVTAPSSGALVDGAHQTIWDVQYSAPYGGELYRTVIDTDGATRELVKDIQPGSGSGTGGYFGDGYRAVLPDGRLVFRANDGVHGDEPWVSDGTVAGTFMLADLGSGANDSSWPGQFTVFGDKVALTASAWSPPGSEPDTDPGEVLVFTDGTSAGTSWLDVDPEGYWSSPGILGEAGGLLYFTAEQTNEEGQTSHGIFSSDGESFTRLGDIAGDAAFLGQTATAAFFRAGDSEHGEELWAVDLSGSGSFELVKDVLPGTGSALAGSNDIFVAGDKLAFTAYTSDVAQGFFLSDGTGEGTVKVGASVPLSTVILDEVLVFADAQGVHAVNLAAQTVEVSGLGPEGVVGEGLQHDADQVFFRSDSGELFASDGTETGTVLLASEVVSFKVVAEDALYLIQQQDGEASLWSSDGTANGTHLVAGLDGNPYSYDLANAVAVKTVGFVDATPEAL